MYWNMQYYNYDTIVMLFVYIRVKPYFFCIVYLGSNKNSRSIN